MRLIYERTYNGKKWTEVSVATVVKHLGAVYKNEEEIMDLLHRSGEVSTRYAAYRVRAGE